MKRAELIRSFFYTAQEIIKLATVPAAEQT